MVKNTVLQQRISEFFKKIFGENFGSSFNLVLDFYFKQKHNCSPYELLWEKPYMFYTTLEKIFGKGVEVIIGLIAENLGKQALINLTSEEVARLMKSRSKQSKVKLQAILRRTVKFKGSD